MAIRGVNPSYFAGMPAVALDPKASKQNPQYAQMLTQAMQNRAQATDKRREFEKESEFKARDQSQTARRDRRANEISKRNSAVNEAGEARLKSGADFDQDRLKREDTLKLIEAAHRAKAYKDQTTYDFLNSELEKRGVINRSKQAPVEDFESRDSRLGAPAPPPAAPPAAPPVDRSPMPPRSPPPSASFPPAGEAEAAPPMRGAPAGVAPRATASFPPASGAAPPGPAAAPPPPAARAPTSPTEGIPFINKTQDMSWIEGKQPPLSMPAKRANYDGSALPQMEGLSPSRVGFPPGWKPPPPAGPPPPDRSAYGESMDDFERYMEEGRQPSDTDLLNMAISKIVKGETGRDIQIPPTEPPRALLPGRTSLLGRP